MNILPHLKLVPWAFREIRPRAPWGILPEDILQSGYLGLVIAGERFANIGEGHSFPAYALCWIRGMMWEEVRRWVGRSGYKRQFNAEALPEVEEWRLAVPPNQQALVAWDLERLLGHLPFERRYLVEEVCLKERSVTDVAKELGLSMTVASKRYRYAIGKLRDLALQRPQRTYTSASALRERRRHVA